MAESHERFHSRTQRTRVVCELASSQKRVVQLKLSHGRLERNIVNSETDLSDCQNVFILFITAESGAKVNLFYVKYSG